MQPLILSPFGCSLEDLGGTQLCDQAVSDEKAFYLGRAHVSCVKWCGLLCHASPFVGACRLGHCHMGSCLGFPSLPFSWGRAFYFGLQCSIPKPHGIRSCNCNGYCSRAFTWPKLAESMSTRCARCTHLMHGQKFHQQSQHDMDKTAYSIPMPSCEDSFQRHVQSYPASFIVLQFQQTSPRNEIVGK